MHGIIVAAVLAAPPIPSSAIVNDFDYKAGTENITPSSSIVNDVDYAGIREQAIRDAIPQSAIVRDIDFGTAGDGLVSIMCEPGGFVCREYLAVAEDAVEQHGLILPKRLLIHVEIVDGPEGAWASPWGSERIWIESPSVERAKELIRRAMVARYGVRKAIPAEARRCVECENGHEEHEMTDTLRPVGSIEPEVCDDLSD